MAVKTNPGKKRFRAIFNRLNRAETQYAGGTYTPVKIGEFWASMEPLSSRESFTAMQTQSSSSHRIKTRWHAGIKSKDQIVIGSDTFRIDSMRIDKVNDEIEFICTLEPNPGT